MTRSTRTVPMLGAAAALVLALTACSSGSGDSEYCDLITDAEENASLADADPADPEAIEQLTATFREIGDAAPDDIQGDWETLAAAFEAFNAEEPPTDDAELADMDTALQNVEQHVQDECGIDMS